MGARPPVCGAPCHWGGLALARRSSKSDLGWMWHCNRRVRAAGDRCWQHVGVVLSFSDDALVRADWDAYFHGAPDQTDTPGPSAPGPSASTASTPHPYGETGPAESSDGSRDGSRAQRV